MKNQAISEISSQRIVAVPVILAVALCVGGLLVHVSVLKFVIAPTVLVLAFLALIFPKNKKGLLVFGLIILGLLACYGLFLFALSHGGLFPQGSKPGDF